MGDVFFRLFLVLVVVRCGRCGILNNAIEDDDDNRKQNQLLDMLKDQIQEKEVELENAEKINKNFERMIQLVNILGQVDTFLTDRTKTVLKKLALLADDLDVAKNNKPNYKITF